MSLKPGFWRKCRIAFRCARFTVWVAVLVLFAAFAWFNLVGLPDFLKTRLVASLHEKGVDLEFTRMRLRLIHGLICDYVRVGQAEDATGPVLTAKEVQLRLDMLALLHRKLQVKGLVLHRGRFEYPLSATDSLMLTNLESELRFGAEDKWSLDWFRADLRGMTFNLAGEVEHAPEFRKWKMFSTAKDADKGSVEASLKNFSDTLKKIHFAGKPQLNARLSGDASDVHSFDFAINVRAPGVETPWFCASNLEFAARVGTPTNAPLRTIPDWAFWTNIQPFRIEYTARASNVKLGALEGDAVETAATWNAPDLAVTRLSVRLGGGSLDGTAKLSVDSRDVQFTIGSGFDLHALGPLLAESTRAQLEKIVWKTPPQIHAGGLLVLPAWTNQASSWQADIEPNARLHGDIIFSNAIIAGAPVDLVETHFRYAGQAWSIPDMKVTRGRTELEMSAEASQHPSNFRVVAGGKLDSETLKPFFTHPDTDRAFSHLFFREPVALVLDIRGNLDDLTTLSATGRVVATDFAIRGQWVDSLITTLLYTNQVAEFYHPQLTRASGREKFAADRVILDLAEQKLFLHGGQGHVSPIAVAECIGPVTARCMAPYQFLSVPDATVEGCIPLKFHNGDLVPDDADLRFNILGTVPFRWKRFQTPGITGTIHWLANNLILTNVHADCYGGPAQGWGKFDLLTPGAGTDFSFYMEGTNVDFNAMGRALWSPTNQLRGGLSGKVMVTYANSDDWRTWDGHGQAQLSDGLLWDAPVFGLVSKLLNTLTPGLDIGNSRATDGAGHFTMTNGVIHTDSLEIRSMTMRIQYIGTVDLEENVSARAKAQLLRNTPVVGSVVSTVLWPVTKAFECSVKGTLDQPKITPIYIPFASVLTAPLHPIRTMEEIFSSPSTNHSARP